MSRLRTHGWHDGIRFLMLRVCRSLSCLSGHAHTFWYNSFSSQQSIFLIIASSVFCPESFMLERTFFFFFFFELQEQPSAAPRFVIVQPPSCRFLIGQPPSCWFLIGQPPLCQFPIGQPPCCLSVIRQPLSWGVVFRRCCF